MHHFFSILLKLAIAMNSSCYTIEDAIKLNKHVMSFNKNLVKVKQLKDCYAFVYYLPDNSIVVLTPKNTLQENSKGFLFKDTVCFEKNYQVALEKIQCNSPLMCEKKNIFHINDNIHVFEERLKNNLKEDAINFGRDSLYMYYKKISLIQDKEMRENSFLMFSILFGEMLRRETQSKWITIKYPDEYDFYWMPALLTKENKVVLFFDMTFTKFQSDHDSFSFNSFINRMAPITAPNFPQIPIENYQASEYIIK